MSHTKEKKAESMITEFVSGNHSKRIRARVVGALAARGYQIHRTRTDEQTLLDGTQALRRIIPKTTDELEKRFVGLLTRLGPVSNAQNFQDLFALAVCGEEAKGYYCEFGAADGILFSNTFLLEKNYGWSGVLAEPGAAWLDRLRQNRPQSVIDPRCVWRSGGEVVEFLEAPDGLFSTITSFENTDAHVAKRSTGKKYSVATVTLRDLLADAGAPSVVDFLSIDTEGSEYEILSAHDFEKFRFRCIVVEHNFRSDQQDIDRLLTSNGYRSVLSGYSENEAWYVHAAEFQAR